MTSNTSNRTSRVPYLDAKPPEFEDFFANSVASFGGFPGFPEVFDKTLGKKSRIQHCDKTPSNFRNSWRFPSELLALCLLPSLP
jgi:hypothetical protein